MTSLYVFACFVFYEDFLNNKTKRTINPMTKMVIKAMMMIFLYFFQKIDCVYLINAISTSYSDLVFEEFKYLIC